MLDRSAVKLLLAAALATVLALTLPGFSTATFTASSTSTASVRAATDWTPPTVAMEHPGSPVQGDVTLTATASDAESGIQDVTLEYLPVGGSSWAPICVVTSSPYSCTWSTRDLADGAYDLRATATDLAGFRATSDTVRITVSGARIELTRPGDVVRGTVPLTTSLPSGSYIVQVQYAPAGSTSWSHLCYTYQAPYTCSWNTTSIADGSYDLRAVAVSWSGLLVSPVVTNVMVDNTAPTVTMRNPGTTLRRTVTFSANASDGHSGVAQVVLQYVASGSTRWRNLCTVSADPWSCSYDTTALSNGRYSFRAVATDIAGNTATSSAVTNRTVDNHRRSSAVTDRAVDDSATSSEVPDETVDDPATPSEVPDETMDDPATPSEVPDEATDTTVSTVAMVDPGAVLTGTVRLGADASSTAGITSVRLQLAAAGTSAWTDVCTVISFPYSCSWDTTSVPDGRYDVRAVLVDGSGGVTISAVETGRRVHNPAPDTGDDTPDILVDGEPVGPVGEATPRPYAPSS